MGFLFLVRPLDGLIIGFLTGLWCLRYLLGKGGMLQVVAYCLGCVLIGSLVFPFNAALTGEMLTTPLNNYIEGT